MATIKAEPEVKTELHPDDIKLEPGYYPAAADDELYEDAGDLEFFDPVTHNAAFNSIYLARMPKYVWEAWESIDDDEEIEIGQMRYWIENEKPQMQLLLNSDRPEHRELPKEYALTINGHDVNNTYIFTEEDLPGFKAKTQRRAEASALGIPLALLARREAEDKEKNDKEKEDADGAGGAGGKSKKKGGDRSQGQQRWQPYYRKAIPSKWKHLWSL